MLCCCGDLSDKIKEFRNISKNYLTKILPFKIKMMTKKHFIQFAEAISRIKDDIERSDLTDFCSRIFKESNPKFDKDIFTEYIRKLRE